MMATRAARCAWGHDFDRGKCIGKAASAYAQAPDTTTGGIYSANAREGYDCHQPIGRSGVDCFSAATRGAVRALCVGEFP